MATTTIPPVDKSGEAKRAALALSRCRNLIQKAELTLEWQRWVAESVLAGLAEATKADAK